MQPKSFRSLEILHKYVIMYPIPKRMVIQMKIDVITYRDKLYDNMLNGHTVIVIDVLRCTSAIIAALDNGAAKIIPAVEPGDATAYANRIGIKDCILGGERGCLILPGFNVGNSPFEYNRETVGGKTVIISTSNGTAAICGVRNARHIFLGALSNCSAAARKAAGFMDDILIVCSGTNRMISADDLCAAGAIINRLRSLCSNLELTDIALICEHLYNSFKSGTFDLHKTFHCARLISLGFERDVDYCLSDAAVQSENTPCETYVSRETYLSGTPFVQCPV